MDKGVIRGRPTDADAGQGGMAWFDAPSHDGLHGNLIQWLEFVQAEMRGILFITSEEMGDLLETEVLNGIALSLLRLR